MILFACSGPGAGETISRNIEIGYTHSAIAGGLLTASLLLCALRFCKWIFPFIMLGLVALHPAWTISAISGDCGFLKRDASLFFTAIGILALVTQAGFALASRRRGRLFQDGAPREDVMNSNDTDGEIREGEPPIIARFKRNTGG